MSVEQNQERLLNKFGIEWEEFFLNLFGYSAVGPDNGDRWNVIDASGNYIGFIQFKNSDIYKIKKYYHNEELYSDVDYPVEFYMEIASPLVQMSNHRVIDRNSHRCSFEDFLNSNTYTFKLKGKDGYENIDLNLGKVRPFLSIKSEFCEDRENAHKKFNFIEFSTMTNWTETERIFFIDFISQNEEFKTHEKISGTFDADKKRNKELHYSKFQVDKDRNLIPLNTIFNETFEKDSAYLSLNKEMYYALLKKDDPFHANNMDITFGCEYAGDYYGGGLIRKKDVVTILEKDLDENNFIRNIQHSVEDGNLEEKIMINPYLIDVLNRFKTLASEILSFNPNILSSLFENVSAINPLFAFLMSFKPSVEEDFRKKIEQKI